MSHAARINRIDLKTARWARFEITKHNAPRPPRPRGLFRAAVDAAVRDYNLGRLARNQRRRAARRI